MGTATVPADRARHASMGVSKPARGKEGAGGNCSSKGSPEKELKLENGAASAQHGEREERERGAREKREREREEKEKEKEEERER